MLREIEDGRSWAKPTKNQKVLGDARSPMVSPEKVAMIFILSETQVLMLEIDSLVQIGDQL